MTKTVTCRHGIAYKLTAHGERGAQQRLFDLMTRCCCYVCHNHYCKEPRNERIEDCGEVCELWDPIRAPFCEAKDSQ